MGHHTIKKGECLSSISAARNLADWRKIYFHSNNQELRRKRPDPNIVYPGDVVFIPDRESGMEPGATESRHRFRMKSTEAFLRVRILNEDGEAVANQLYRLIMDQERFEGRTDGNGKIDNELPRQLCCGVVH